MSSLALAIAGGEGCGNDNAGDSTDFVVDNPGAADGGGDQNGGEDGGDPAGDGGIARELRDRHGPRMCSVATARA